MMNAGMVDHKILPGYGLQKAQKGVGNIPSPRVAPSIFGVPSRVSPAGIDQTFVNRSVPMTPSELEASNRARVMRAAIAKANQDLANRPTMQQSTREYNPERVYEYNRRAAAQQGLRFDDRTGQVSRPFTDQQERYINRAFDNIVMPMFEMSPMGAVGDIAAVSKPMFNRIGSMATQLGRVPSKLYDNYIFPIQYRKEIKNLNLLHDQASARFKDPEVVERLKILGIDPEQMELPPLVISPRWGSHYNPSFNYVHIDLPQIKKLNKDGMMFSPESVYEHEMGHYLQREAYKQSPQFQRELAEYERELADWRNSPDPVQSPMPVDDQAAMKKWYEELKKSLRPAPSKPIPKSEQTILDHHLLDLYEVDNITREMGRNLNFRNRNSFNNAQYFGYDVEAMPHLREMRQNMMDKGYIQDRYQKIPADVIEKFIRENSRDRISSFTDFSDPKYAQKLSELFYNLPSAVPPIIVAGAAGAAATKKKNGGPIISPFGQWAHPGKRTMVPTSTGQITMKGVPYPVFGQDETGYGQMMYPGGEYQFPGQMVDEIPMMRQGGISGVGRLRTYQNAGTVTEPEYKSLPEIIVSNISPRVAAQNKILQETRPKKNYAIVDKESNLIHYFNPSGKIIGTEKVITGASNNDNDAGLSMREFFEKNDTSDHEEYFNYLKQNSFQTTPSGLYNISGLRTDTAKNPDWFGSTFNKLFRPERERQIEEIRRKDYGEQQKLFTLKSQFGIPSSKAIHGTGREDRIQAFTTGDDNARNMSNGCINVNGQTICFDTLEKGSSIAILPEESDAIVHPQKMRIGRRLGSMYDSTKKKIVASLINRGINPTKEAVDFIASIAEKESKGGRSLYSKVEQLAPYAISKSQGAFQINPSMEAFGPYLPSDWDGSFDSSAEAVYNFYDKHKNLEPVQMYQKYRGGADKRIDRAFKGIYERMKNLYAQGGIIKMQSGGQHGGLDRWFAEKWVDIKTGKPCGRQEGEKRGGYPACRPSKRINSQTPKTSSELSAAEREKFKRSKTSSERINYQHRRK